MPSENISPDPASIPSDTVARRDDSSPYRDLCSTCNHAEVCGWRSTPQRPIFFCEEFDTSTPCPPPESARPIPGPTPEKQALTERTGLCMNCDNAATCGFPKVEGGIWHCTEYQ